MFSRQEPQRAQRWFSPELPEVRAARVFAAETVSSWGYDPSDVALVVQELSANAVVHGRTTFGVEVLGHDGHIRVGVHDDNPRVPLRVNIPADARSGRGLNILDSLSSRWGVEEASDDGKVIWAEMEARAPRPAGVAPPSFPSAPPG